MHSVKNNKASKGLMQHGCWNGSYLIKKMWDSADRRDATTWSKWFWAYFGAITWSYRQSILLPGLEASAFVPEFL